MPKPKSVPGPVTEYLAAVEPKHRAALERLRKAVLSVAPSAAEGVSYGMPAFKLGKKPIASFMAFRDHLSFFPMSGTVLAGFQSELAGFKASKGTIRFSADHPLPTPLVRRIVRARIAELQAQEDGKMRRPHSRQRSDSKMKHERRR